MDSYKICSTCKKENSVSEMLCFFCMADISSIRPIENKNATVTFQSDNDKTIIESFNLILKLEDGNEINVKSGDFVGRNYIGSDFFQNSKTLSRKHAQFTFQNGIWFVEDLNTTNGVYLEGQKITPATKIQIKNGQKLALSNSVETIVIIK